ALNNRRQWRPGQAETVLKMARRAAEPEIRVAAVGALVNLTDRELLESVSEFLYDPSRRVRKAATETLLANWEQNWNWVRPAVRKALAEPLCQNDGPLQSGGGALGPDVLSDLTAWASEK